MIWDNVSDIYKVYKMSWNQEKQKYVLCLCFVFSQHTN